MEVAFRDKEGKFDDGKSAMPLQLKTAANALDDMRFTFPPSQPLCNASALKKYCPSPHVLSGIFFKKNNENNIISSIFSHTQQTCYIWEQRGGGNM